MNIDISKKIKEKTPYPYKNFTKVIPKKVLHTNVSSSFYKTDEYICHGFYKYISLLTV